MQAVDQFNEMKVYGDSHIVQLNSDTIDNVSIDISNTSNGWNVQNEVRMLIYYSIMCGSTSLIMPLAFS